MTLMKSRICYFLMMVFTIILLESTFFVVYSVEKNVEQKIEAIMAEHDAIGMAVVVVRDTSIIYSHAFGYNPDYQYPELRTPIPEDGVFWIASVSKTIISATIMSLVERGEISLDDDINKYLGFPITNPYYPETPITIRMLLCHRSSLNDSQGGRQLDQLQVSNKDYIKNFNKHKPGARYEYCNLGYNLLGAIIENVTNERFDRYIERAIIHPLDIEGTFDLTRVNQEKLVRSYNYDKKKRRYVGSPSVYDYSSAKKALENYSLGLSTGRLSPAGGMKMRASDLACFMMMLMNGGELNGVRILKKESIEEMCTPQGENKSYGLAMTTYGSIVKGHPLTGMRGGSHGIHSIMVYDQENKIGFVIINNGYNTDAKNGADLNYRIIRLLYKYFVSH